MKYLIIFMISISVLGMDVSKVTGGAVKVLMKTEFKEGKEKGFEEGEVVYVLHRNEMEKCREYQLIVKKGIKCPACEQSFWDTGFGTVRIVTGKQSNGKSYKLYT